MSSELKSEEWLAAIAGLGSDRIFAGAKQVGAQVSSGPADRSFVLHAILLLRGQP
jgi:hypothetical protein